MTPITAPEEARAVAFGFPEPEELAPPIVALEGVAVGYEGRTVLSRLDLRIDQDDRIALLGRNGQGKSTLSKLLAGRLAAQGGRISRSGKLRIGYFAQHQVDELELDETPIQHLQRLRPDEAPARLRARLAAFGLMAEQAETVVGRLSGGQKARLSLLLATIDAPHMLILDEPTNHLDIESREALVEALTTYSGAVVLVSHDMHLLGLVADRLWLVKDGRVTPYTDDLEAYRAQLLAADPAPAAPKPAATPLRPTKPDLTALRADLRKAEERLDKLEALRARIDEKLSDPNLWTSPAAAQAPELQKKYAELRAEIEKAETAWIEAQERLDAARA